MNTRATILTLLLVAGAAPVAGQSLFNAAGLGVPIEALDGRARALGSVGIGLPGGGFAPSDPASLARLRISTGIMAAQPSWVDFNAGSAGAGSFNGNRFPLLGLAYPLAGGMASVQIGSFMDQHYRATSTSVVDVSSGAIAANDEFIQDGSVSTLNLGYARTLTRGISVGVSVGRYAGGVDRTLTRDYGDEETTDVDEYVEHGTWSYRGWSVSAGGSIDFPGGARLAASVEIPTELDAKAEEETAGADRTYGLPLQLRVGGSATLFPGLLLTASGVLSDWSGTQDDLVGAATAGRADGFGVGVELSRARLWGKAVPLRFGFRRTMLPFAFDDEGVSENIFSGGFGLDLNSTNDIVLAAVNFAIERGHRNGTGISEHFWRATVSLQAAGF